MPPTPPICLAMSGPIILAICWLSSAIRRGFTFRDTSPSLKSPLVPPIFLNSLAVSVYRLRELPHMMSRKIFWIL